MESLKADGILKAVEIQTCSGDNADECGPEGTAIRVDVTVVPPADVGSFSEEDRSRQVSTRGCVVCISKNMHMFGTITIAGGLSQKTYALLFHTLYSSLSADTAFTLFSGPITY